jgi:hypothetical protein
MRPTACAGPQRAPNTLLCRIDGSCSHVTSDGDTGPCWRTACCEPTLFNSLDEEFDEGPALFHGQDLNELTPFAAGHPHDAPTGSTDAGGAASSGALAARVEAQGRLLQSVDAKFNRLLQQLEGRASHAGAADHEESAGAARPMQASWRRKNAVHPDA